jgi:hypothetical protein
MGLLLHRHYVAVTTWLSLFMATASEAQTTNSISVSGPNLVSTTTATSPTVANANPNAVVWLAVPTYRYCHYCRHSGMDIYRDLSRNT